MCILQICQILRRWGGVVFPVLNFKVLIKAERLFTKLNGGREKKTCQHPQLELFIDFHSSCFRLITHRATVKLQQETSEEMLLPT